MKELNQNQTGLILGTVAGLFHLLWAVAVALGIAQSILDLIYALHFLNNPFTVTSFSFTNAILLVIVASMVGYAVGWVFALVWNKVLGSGK